MRPTLPYIAVATTSRFRPLPWGVTTLACADRARDAGLAFLASEDTWGRAELADWLVRKYRPSVLDADEPAPLSSARAQTRVVTEETIGSVVTTARDRVRAMVMSASRAWGGKGFAGEMIDAGLVVAVSDDDDALGYAPADRQGMRLVDRVASLFLADYLTRPRDYESVVLCGSCGALAFDWGHEHDRRCAMQSVPPASGVLERSGSFPVVTGIPTRKLRLVGS